MVISDYRLLEEIARNVDTIHKEAEEKLKETRKGHSVALLPSVNKHLNLFNPNICTFNIINFHSTN